MKLILTGDAGWVNLNPEEVEQMNYAKDVDHGPTAVYFSGGSRVMVRSSPNEILQLMRDEIASREVN